MISRVMLNIDTNQENIRLKISMLRSDHCDFSDAYIVVKGTAQLAKSRFQSVIIASAIT